MIPWRYPLPRVFECRCFSVRAASMSSSASSHASTSALRFPYRHRVGRGYTRLSACASKLVQVGWYRWHRSISLGSGLRLNISKSGTSLSSKVGPFTWNSRGRRTAHIAKGLSYTTTTRATQESSLHSSKQKKVANMSGNTRNATGAPRRALMNSSIPGPQAPMATRSAPPSRRKPPTKQPIWKRAWFWVVIVFVAIVGMITECSGTSGATTSNSSTPAPSQVSATASAPTPTQTGIASAGTPSGRQPQQFASFSPVTTETNAPPLTQPVGTVPVSTTTSTRPPTSTRTTSSATRTASSTQPQEFASLTPMNTTTSVPSATRSASTVSQQATTSTKPPTTQASIDSGTVTAGAFCSIEGAVGHTKTGKKMVCKTSNTDSRLRWRAS